MINYLIIEFQINLWVIIILISLLKVKNKKIKKLLERIDSNIFLKKPQ